MATWKMISLLPSIFLHDESLDVTFCKKLQKLFLHLATFNTYHSQYKDLQCECTCLNTTSKSYSGFSNFILSPRYY